MVWFSTVEATPLTTQSPIHIAPTYREFRDSDEIASISVPAESTTIAPKASEASEHPPGVARHQGIEAEGNPSAKARSTGTIVTADKIDGDHAELAREVVEPPHRPGRSRAAWR